MNGFENELQALLKACQQAGQILIDHGTQALERTDKTADGDNPVTAADRASDAYLKQTLCSQFPQYGWLSEETADDLHRLEKDAVWVVDPLDGTKAYIRWVEDGGNQTPSPSANHVFAISAALVVNHVPVVGVIVSPLENLILSAIRGQGVRINSAQAHRQPFATSLSTARSMVDIHKKIENVPQDAAPLFIGKKFGSLAYRLAMVATGMADVDFALNPKSEWDLAAGHLIAEEMGLKLTDRNQQPLTYNQPNTRRSGIILAPPPLHTPLSTLLDRANS